MAHQSGRDLMGLLEDASTFWRAIKYASSSLSTYQRRAGWQAEEDDDSIDYAKAVHTP